MRGRQWLRFSECIPTSHSIDLIFRISYFLMFLRIFYNSLISTNKLSCLVVNIKSGLYEVDSKRLELLSTVVSLELDENLS